MRRDHEPPARSSTGRPGKLDASDPWGPTAAGSMSIGIDVSPLEWPGSGIGRYARELLGALWRGGSSREIVLVAPRSLGPRWLPEVGDDAALTGPLSPSRIAWTYGLLPLWLRRRRLDVFHATSYYAPFGGGVPTVVTFHDLSVLVGPEWHPRARVLRARLLFRQVARRAAAIITPSESAGRDVATWLDVDPGRIHVVPHAAAAPFRPVDRAEAARVAARYGVAPGYFLALGTVEPRKNLVRTIEALEHLRAGGDPARIVVVGGLGWRHQPIVERAAALATSGAVRFLGHVPDDDLPALMGAATALVHPSLYEGFGLPVVEAMAAGLPVITTGTGATAEVAGSAALLVDPSDAEGLAAAMGAVRDPRVAARLRAAGIARAAAFSWERTARETVAVYRAVGRIRGLAS